MNGFTFCPTYGVHDFRVSMEVYHMPTVLLNYQIKKKLPHKSPHLAQIFWVCPEIRVFFRFTDFCQKSELFGNNVYATEVTIEDKSILVTFNVCSNSNY